MKRFTNWRGGSGTNLVEEVDIMGAVSVRSERPMGNVSDSRRGTGGESVTDSPVDVHQHLWPPALVEALRAREKPPMLRGWTLHLDTEPPYEVNPTDHDVAARTALLRGDRGDHEVRSTDHDVAARTALLRGDRGDHEVRSTDHDVAARTELLRTTSRPTTIMGDGENLALVSLSSPLGLEDLAADEAAPLLDAWHDGAAALPEAFGAWAAVRRHEPDLADLTTRLTDGFIGLQVPATWLLSPSRMMVVGSVLEVCERLDKPVFVHPGPSSSTPGEPGWWPAVVDYVGQLQAAWWSWHEAGRSHFPTLRIGFAAGAGLAPLHHERLTARGGRLGAVDPNVFVETSSYGPQAVDGLIRALGIDPIVRGSDHPYAEPATFGFGSAADTAIDIRNPRRFLFGGAP